MTEPARLAELEKKLGHVFADRKLLERALTHASASSIASNERLEFLGDRVLGLVIAQMLFSAYPEDPEGLLALKYNALVRGEACAAAAESMGLSEHMVLASSEAASGGRQKTAILGGTCEALIAALYLDAGFEPARNFIARHWERAFAELSDDMRDPKTMLQEWAQSRSRAARGAPEYRLVRREGPDHAPHFVVEVSVAGESTALGEGRSKREAQQAAAKAMLDQLGRKEELTAISREDGG
ncbi:MAG TPA: ribonuclease III [Rhizomicrobium sp.]|nr:ribonuclease III [Rhizomicrobium sp.]